MATNYIDFYGTCRFAQVYDPDNAFGASKWKIDLFLDNDDEWKKLKESGIQKKIKENNSPEFNSPIGKYVQFTRDAYKTMKENIVNFSGPVVYMQKDGELVTIVDYVDNETDERMYSFSTKEKSKVVRRGKPILIGNGSHVKVRVAVYDTQKGKGQRLDSVTILNLVEYEKPVRESPKLLEDVRTPLADMNVGGAPTEKSDTNPPW